MAGAQELLAAVYADPRSDAPRLVYADWLSARGDQLGEFIALSIARAAKKKRTQAREKLLMAANQGWWSDHPCAAMRLSWSDTHRGFPVRFTAPWSPSDLAAPAAIRSLIANPGWSTVEHLALNFDATTDELGELLANADLVSVRQLSGLPSPLLPSLAERALPVRELELWVRRDEHALEPVTGLRELRELVVDIRRPAPAALEAVAATQLLPRLEQLELRAVTSRGVGEALTLHRALPRNVTRLRINHFYGSYVDVEGDPRAPSVTVSLTAGDVEAACEELAALDEATLGALTVHFAAGGFFTKRERPALAARVAEATRKWAGRLTLPSS